MVNVTYGPHLLPGLPELYLRMPTNGMTLETANSKILETLVEAFNPNQKESLSSQLGIPDDSHVSLSFLNYGSTEMVYLATVSGSDQFVILVNQPNIKPGVVKSEFENLGRLSSLDTRFIIKPLAYFNFGPHELYATNYEKHALCISHYFRSHGIYDPLPKYHFERFTSTLSESVNESIIALLVNYYDERFNRGIGHVQISGNDFILTRDFNKTDPDSVLPNMRLIAARISLEVPLPDYLDLIRQEFLRGTDHHDYFVTNNVFEVNHRSKYPLNEETIEKGIELGLKLRKQRT